MDFCVTQDIPQEFAVAKSCFDVSSDHSPALIALTVYVLNEERQTSLSNRHTNWDDFTRFVNERLTLIPLKPKNTLKQ
jgi:hypothetical protein